jgi:hypothetical protein
MKFIVHNVEDVYIFSEHISHEEFAKKHNMCLGDIVSAGFVSVKNNQVCLYGNSEALDAESTDKAKNIIQAQLCCVCDNITNRPQTDLDEFIILCNTIHQNDRYGIKPYSFHLNAVYEKIARSTHATIEDKMIAYGHDLFEDHPNDITFDDIKNNYGSIVANGIMYLTKHESTEYLDYIDGLIKAAPLNIIAIKLADLSVNYELGIEIHHPKVQVYKQAIDMIRSLLCEKYGSVVLTYTIDSVIDKLLEIHHLI